MSLLCLHNGLCDCLFSQNSMSEHSSNAAQQSTLVNENSSVLCNNNDMTWSKLTTNSHYCNVYEYTGTICGNVLSKWHQCAVGSSDITINNSIISQHLLEDEIQELDALLGYNSTYTSVHN